MYIVIVGVLALPFSNFAMEFEQSRSKIKKSLLSYTVANTLDEKIRIKFFMDNVRTEILLKPHRYITISGIPESTKTSVQILKKNYPAIILTPQFNIYEIKFKDRDYIFAWHYQGYYKKCTFTKLTSFCIIYVFET